MRRIELLIDESREATESTEFSEGAGLQDSEFIRWANDAQERVFGKIAEANAQEREVEVDIDVVANQEAYDIPDDAFLRHKIRLVEFSSTGQEDDFYDLDKGSLKERIRGSGTPAFWIRRDRQILIQPRPQSSGVLRLTYVQAPPRIDKRRGTISSVVLDSATRTITSLVLDATTFDSDNATLLANVGYLTIVDRDGAIKMGGIPVASIDATTGVVTLDGAFVYEEDETAAAGYYVVAGKRASSHCQLDDCVEKYLLAHMDWKALKRDSSNDSIEQADELSAMIADIVANYANADEEIQGVPIIDTQFLDSDGGF
jgi:hypothetical protein